MTWNRDEWWTDNRDMLDCRTCTDDAFKRRMACPDLGLVRPDDDLIPFGGLGDERRASAHLPHCVGFYKRHPTQYAGLPWAVDSRSVFDIACEAKWAMEHGGLGTPLRDLPGPLHDAIVTLAAEEAHVERVRHEQAMAKMRGAGGRERLRHVDGVGLVRDG